MVEEYLKDIQTLEDGVKQFMNSGKEITPRWKQTTVEAIYKHEII